MKFGLLLENSKEPKHSKYYINYGYLKGKLKFSRLSSYQFINILTNEINKVESYYTSTQNISKDFCILNVFATLKITKKFNKYNHTSGIAKKIYDKLFTCSFYSDLFQCELSNDTCENSESCCVCYSGCNYMLTLPCNHTVCWNCCLQCYINNYSKCPYCIQPICLNPLLLKLEELTKNKCNPLYFPIMKIPERVLLLGIDGLRPDCLLFANTPILDNLIQKSSFTFDAITNSETISGPSWSAIFTGKKNTFTGIYNNEKVENKNFKWVSSNIFTELKKINVHTESIVSTWSGIPNIVQNSSNLTFIDNENVIENDKEIVDLSLKYIKQNKLQSELLFTYLNSIDFYGHKYGFTLQSKEYIRMIEQVDTMLSELIENAIQQRWSIIVTTDHGGCKYTDLPNNLKNEFDKKQNVQSQIKKGCSGVHGLTIPQHKRTFQLFYGDHFKTKELLDTQLSTDIYKTILSLFK